MQQNCSFINFSLTNSVFKNLNYHKQEEKDIKSESNMLTDDFAAPQVIYDDRNKMQQLVEDLQNNIVPAINVLYNIHNNSTCDNLPIDNILLPTAQFFTFLKRNLRCKHCDCNNNQRKKKKGLDPKVLERSKQHYQLEIYGAAHNLFYHCQGCGFKDQIVQEILCESKENSGMLKNSKGAFCFNNNAGRINSSQFAINQKNSWQHN